MARKAQMTKLTEAQEIYLDQLSMLEGQVCNGNISNDQYHNNMEELKRGLL